MVMRLQLGWGGSPDKQIVERNLQPKKSAESEIPLISGGGTDLHWARADTLAEDPSSMKPGIIEVGSDVAEGGVVDQTG